MFHRTRRAKKCSALAILSGCRPISRTKAIVKLLYQTCLTSETALTEVEFQGTAHRSPHIRLQTDDVTRATLSTRSAKNQNFLIWGLRIALTRAFGFNSRIVSCLRRLVININALLHLSVSFSCLHPPLFLEL